LQRDRCLEMNLEVRQIMSEFASRTENVLAGSFWEEKDGRIYNAFELFTPDGEKCSPYQKLHLFKPGKENMHFEPGRHAPQCFEWKGIKIGFGICHDCAILSFFCTSTNSSRIFLYSLRSGLWPGWSTGRPF